MLKKKTGTRKSGGSEASGSGTPHLRVSRLEIKNYKRVEAVAVTPGTASLIIFQGPNAAGKTTGIECIAAAMAGRASVAEDPVRKGAPSSRIKLVLADGLSDKYEVVSTCNGRGKNGTLMVTDLRRPDGTAGRTAVPGSPQTFLDGLVADLSFDPLKPLTIKQLLGALGLTEEYDQITGKRAAAYASRTEAGRTLKAAKAGVAANPNPSPDRVLAKKSSADLAEQLESYREHNETVANADRQVEEFEGDIQQLKEKLVEIRKEQGDAEGSLAEWKAYREKLGPGHDEAETQAAIAKADSHNDMVAKQVKAAECTAVEAAASKAHKDLNDTVASCDESARLLLSGALESRDGLSGLSIDEETSDILFKGHPLSQASGMERLRLGVAVGVAQNKPFRVFNVDSLDTFDDDHLKALCELAAAENFQVWGTSVRTAQDIGVGDNDNLKLKGCLIVRLQEGREVDASGHPVKIATVDEEVSDWGGE